MSLGVDPVYETGIEHELCDSNLDTPLRTPLPGALLPLDPTKGKLTMDEPTMDGPNVTVFGPSFTMKLGQALPLLDGPSVPQGSSLMPAMGKTFWPMAVSVQDDGRSYTLAGKARHVGGPDLGSVESHLLAAVTHARTSVPYASNPTNPMGQRAQMMEHMRCELNGPQLQYGILPVDPSYSGLVLALYLVTVGCQSTVAYVVGSAQPTWSGQLLLRQSSRHVLARGSSGQSSAGSTCLRSRFNFHDSRLSCLSQLCYLSTPC